MGADDDLDAQRFGAGADDGDGLRVNEFGDEEDVGVGVARPGALAEVKGPVRDKFHKSGLTEKLGDKHFFVTVDDAFKAIQGQHNEYTPGIALQTNALGGQ